MRITEIRKLEMLEIILFINRYEMRNLVHLEINSTRILSCIVTVCISEFSMPEMIARQSKLGNLKRFANNAFMMFSCESWFNNVWHLFDMFSCPIINNMNNCSWKHDVFRLIDTRNDSRGCFPHSLLNGLNRFGYLHDVEEYDV